MLGKVVFDPAFRALQTPPAAIPSGAEGLHATRSHHPYAYGLTGPMLPVVRTGGPGFTVFSDGRAFIDPLARAFFLYRKIDLYI